LLHIFKIKKYAARQSYNKNFGVANNFHIKPVSQLAILQEFKAQRLSEPFSDINTRSQQGTGLSGCFCG
jgi:hypothetical protein